jgi:hypothetical protein
LHLGHPGKFITDVETPCPQLWEHNPYVTPLPRQESGIEILSMEYPMIHKSNEGSYHFLHGFRLDLESKLGINIPAGKFWGDIHLSRDECRWMGMVQQHFTGRDTPYWLISIGGKKDFTVKWWIPEFAQQVVDHFRNRIQFVQFGASGPNHYHPPLKGVINVVGHTDLRQLIRLVYHSSGVVCPITFAAHLAAAIPAKPGYPVRKPCVVTAGGREPSNFEAYTNHIYIHTNGQLRCSANGGCWRSRITPLGDGDPKDENLCLDTVNFKDRKVQRCMHDLVTAADVIGAIERYYRSGMLQYLSGGISTLEASWDQRVSK